MFGITASQLLGAGFSPGQANALISSSVGSGISAAGTTRGTATALSKSINLVSTASSGQGVALPTGYTTNDTLLVYNDNTGVAFYVYPESATVQINGFAVGNGVLLANNTGLMLVKATSTRWVGVLSA